MFLGPPSVAHFFLQKNVKKKWRKVTKTVYEKREHVSTTTRWRVSEIKFVVKISSFFLSTLNGEVRAVGGNLYFKKYILARTPYTWPNLILVR